MRTYVSADEFAEMMGLNPHAVRRMCARGELGAVKCGSRWRIPLDESPEADGPAEDARLDAIVHALDAMGEAIAAMNRELDAMRG